MAGARSAAYLVARLLAPFELLLFAIAILVARQSSREPGAPQKADSNNNGIADAWEFLYFGGLLGPGQQNNVGPNGNGMTLLQDYQDGTNPLLANTACASPTIPPTPAE